jgi:hypothetical protein
MAMKLGYIISHASAQDRSDFHFLALRFDQRYGFKPNEGESWILRATGGKLYSLYGGLTWFTGLWRSPSGRVYVSSADSAVVVNDDPRVGATPFKEIKVKGTLAGIWGLDDRFVLAWGIHQGKGIMYRFDGKKWSSMESPGEIYGVHGLAPNLVYAVGLKGLIARWDGVRWKKLPSPTKAVLSDVHVAREDETYAVGDGVVLKGSADGWTVAAKGTSHMFGVAKWKGEVYVGAAQNGLLKLSGNKLIAVDPAIKAERIDARGELIVSSPDAVAVSADGKDFKRLRVIQVADLYKDRKPAWTK